MRFTARIVSALLLCTAIRLSAADKPSPADYTIPVHVIASYALPEDHQVLEATVEGRHVLLQGYARGVLALGDYKAMRYDKAAVPTKAPNGYDEFMGYRILFLDGVTREYRVVGFCMPEAQSCARP